MTNVFTYIAYLAVSIALTVWVAKTLRLRGRTFLVEAFGGNDELADSVNHLLVVGFYLINAGYITLTMKSEETLIGARAAMEMLSDKIGFVLLVLGVMHFFNLFVFSKIRNGQRPQPSRPRHIPVTLPQTG